MITTETATIANGQTTSGAVNIGAKAILVIVFPTMTGASATITASQDGSTYQTLGDESGTLTIQTPSARTVHLDINKTWGVQYVKIVSAGAEGAERAIKLYMVDII